MEAFWDIFDKTSILIGVLGLPTLVFTFFTWYKVSRQNRIIRDSIKSLSATPPDSFEQRREWGKEINTLNPVALCMSLVPNDQSISILADVQSFLREKGGRFAAMQVIELNSNGIKPDEIGTFLQLLKNKRLELEAMNATEIHLFIQGPVMACVMVGNLFSNWRLVKLYSKNLNTKQYEYWNVLEK